MPNLISLLPASLPQITHDPTVTLNGDPMGVIGSNPYGSMTNELLFGAVNTLLGWIDDATGLDLLAIVSPLESLLGGSTGLLSGLLGFLTPGGSTAGGGVFGPLLGLIPGLGGGTGTLGGLGSFLNPTSFIGAAAGIFAPLLSGGSLLGGLIPGLDASKIISGTFGVGLLQPVIDAVSQGFGGSSGLGFGGLQTFLSGLSLVGVAFSDILALIPGLSGGLSGSTGLGSVFTDLFGMLGSPTAVGSGSPVLPGIGSIPLLGGLLSGGNLLGSLIPGLDASKIISGTFGASILQPVIDAVSQGFGGSTGLGFGGLQSFLGGLSFGGISFDDLIALIPGIGTGLTGSTGLGSIFTDLTGILGSPTGLGTGTTALPGIGSIPLLGGLLSGGNLLGSLIPGLDASKIISGVFGTGLIPGLDISKITSGLLSGGSILTSLIPGLDASKIISGLFPISQITNLSTLLGGFGTGSSILTQLIGVIPGLTGGLTGLGGLGSIFTDLTGMLGSPTALGSGTPVLPGISSIPLLGGLLSGGNILGSIIPGLDASKIISGLFPISQITNLSTLLSGFGTGSSIITQLIGVIPGLTGGLTGLGGLTSIFTDLTGLLGAPTALGSGTPVLPGIGSIPVLGGLLSGGNILGSIIPGLDASKITTGAFSLGQLPGTVLNSVTGVASSLLSGVLGAGLIPSLDASKIATGVLGAGLIPSLPASQIGSGVFGTSLIPNLPASILTSGTLLSSLIPALDGSKITTGAIGGAVTVPAANLTGTITETVTGLNTLRDSITKGLFGSASGSGYVNTDAQNASAQTATVAAQALAAANAANATLAAQQATTNSNQGSGGINVNIVPSGADGAALSATQFSSTGPTSGNMCIRGANGYVGIASSVATNSTVYGIINATYATQNQSIAISLGDQGSYNGANTTLLTHCNTTLTLGAYCRIANDGIVIGSFTRSAGTFAFTPFTGGTWSGNVSGRVEFRNIGTTWFILVNGSQVLTCTNATVTLTNFTPGLAMERAHASGGFFGWGSGDYDSYRAAAIAVADYVQPTYVGSGARMYRASATQLTPTYTVNTNIALPVNFWDNLDKNSADITVNLSAGSFTVANAGWYDVSCRYVCVPGSMTGQFSVCPILIVGGGTAAVEYGPSSMGGIASSTDATRFPLYAITGSFKVYLAANSVVSVGYRHEGVAGNVWKILGGSSQACYFDIQLDNKSLA